MPESPLKKKSYPAGTRFVVRNHDRSWSAEKQWQRVWGANLTQRDAQRLKEWVCARRWSKNAIFEPMPTEATRLAAANAAKIQSHEDLEDAIAKHLATRGPKRRSNQDHGDLAPLGLLAPTAPAPLGDEVPEDQPNEDLFGMHDEGGDADPGPLSDLLGSDDDLDAMIAAADGAPLAPFEKDGTEG